MSLLIHISDTHFGTEKPPVVAALVALARERRPDVLVFSGDVTQRARQSEFAAAADFCRELGIARMLALPGNHDIPLFDVVGRLFRPYAGYLEAFGPRLEPFVETQDLFVVGVNTTRPNRHKNGVVSAEQVARVSSQLRQARRGQLRIVVTHQPAAVSRPEDEHDRLRGAGPALQAWSVAGADLVLGGHIHLPYVLDLATGPQAVARPMWCVQAGTAVSERVRHGTCNSVNLIEWSTPRAGEPRRCAVERWDYSAKAGGFETAERRILPLA
ncbi:MAG TPA: metallophosphoesterase [Ramlibacter sp.]|uniref:metallophosphoesterase family protein n=1 Tax=Ramlibacter sp. TaxID=1917967 RepID=UPI002D484B7F|nr:metallophosphoesterase [Ramlibacter sp.]HZY18175.1 metallophosphoesterase [Ramlibacter sp.]